MKKNQLPETLEENNKRMDKLGFTKSIVCILPFLVLVAYIALFVKEVRTHQSNPELIVGCFVGVMVFFILMGEIYFLANRKLLKLEKNHKVLLKKFIENIKR